MPLTKEIMGKIHDYKKNICQNWKYLSKSLLCLICWKNYWKIFKQFLTFWRNYIWIFFQWSRYDQASCFLTEAVINAFNAKRAKIDEAIENSDKKKEDSDTSSIKITSDEVKLYDALACVVLSTKNSRQPWALEMLVKVLKQVITSKNTLPMFKSACHSDLKNILPEMAQLQWTLHGNAGIKMISSCPSCQYLGKFNCVSTLKLWEWSEK